MSFGSLIFGAGCFAAGICVGVFLCESKVVTGDDIRDAGEATVATTRKLIEKLKTGADTASPAS